jgi:phosphoribosylanthranilate isomerase
MRTRVKICGITRAEDALAAVEEGADALGLVFYASSPRAVSVERAREIVSSLPPFVCAVGLFVDAKPAVVERVLERVPLNLLQFHGQETRRDCELFGKPYIKALRMRAGTDIRAEAERYGSAAGLLLDAYRPGVPGGTGQVFDWSLVPSDTPKPLIIAGGLEPGNVAEVILRTRPYAVDVSGGVERAKGIKDRARIAEFMKGVRSVDPD